MNGGIELFSEATTFNTSNENTKINAIDIPRARFIPSPPRFFWEDKDKAKKAIFNSGFNGGQRRHQSKSDCHSSV